VNEPETNVPAVTGLNETLIEQLPPEARLVPQVVVLEKPVGFEMLDMFSEFASVFVTFIVRMVVVPIRTSPKANGFGEIARGTLRPDNETVCGLPIASSVMVSMPETVCPTESGEKDTSIEQLAPGARLELHVLD